MWDLAWILKRKLGSVIYSRSTELNSLIRNSSWLEKSILKPYSIWYGFLKISTSFSPLNPSIVINYCWWVCDILHENSRRYFLSSFPSVLITLITNCYFLVGLSGHIITRGYDDSKIVLFWVVLAFMDNILNYVWVSDSL